MAGRGRQLSQGAQNPAPGLSLSRSHGATAANMPLGAAQGGKVEETEGWTWSRRGAPGRPPPQLPEPTHSDTLRASVSLPTNKARKPRPLGLVRT